MKRQAVFVVVMVLTPVLVVQAQAAEQGAVLPPPPDSSLVQFAIASRSVQGMCGPEAGDCCSAQRHARL